MEERYCSAPLRATCLRSAPPPQAPAELHSGRFRFSPLRKDRSPLPAAAALREPSLVPRADPLRWQRLRRLAPVPPPGQPARPLPPAAGVPQAPRPASGFRSRGRLPFRLNSGRAPIKLPVLFRLQPALRRLRSRLAASVPGQIDLRAFLRFLPGNLLPLHPSYAATAAPATFARRACFPSAPGGLCSCRLPSSPLRTGLI